MLQRPVQPIPYNSPIQRLCEMNAQYLKIQYHKYIFVSYCTSKPKKNKKNLDFWFNRLHNCFCMSKLHAVTSSWS